MRRRIDPRGILQPEIRTSPSDNTIDISIPGVKNPNAVANLLVAGQLQSFDFYKFLTPVSTYEHIRGGAESVAVRHAACRQEADPDRDARRLGALLRQDAPQPGQGQRHRLAHRAASEAGAGGSPSEDPAGRDRVAAGAAGHRRGELQRRSAPTRRRRGRSGTCSRSRPRTRRSSPATRSRAPRPTSTRPATRSSRSRTRTAATRTSRTSPAGSPSREPAPRGHPQRLYNAIVVDNQLVAAPTVDPRRIPNGIDATLSGGSEITGVSTAEAERIALEIQSGTLPVKFTPLSAAAGVGDARRGRRCATA